MKDSNVKYVINDLAASQDKKNFTSDEVGFDRILYDNYTNTQEAHWDEALDTTYYYYHSLTHLLTLSFTHSLPH